MKLEKSKGKTVAIDFETVDFRAVVERVLSRMAREREARVEAVVRGSMANAADAIGDGATSAPASSTPPTPLQTWQSLLLAQWAVPEQSCWPRAHAHAIVPPTPAKKQLPFPGLPPARRVVLDLAFRGYGISSEIVAKDGELLGIAHPGSRFDPVPGSIVQTVDLGLAVKRLRDAGARFDLIVADIQPDAHCAAVGAFAPPPPPQARTGRRLILPNRVTPKVIVGSVDLAKSLLGCIDTLLSGSGEALLRMHAVSFNRFEKDKHPLGKHIWWVHSRGNCLMDVYIDKFHTRGDRSLMQRPPEGPDRPKSGVWLSGTAAAFTPGQRQSFEKALGLRT